MNLVDEIHRSETQDKVIDYYPHYFDLIKWPNIPCDTITSTEGAKPLLGGKVFGVPKTKTILPKVSMFSYILKVLRLSLQYDSNLLLNTKMISKFSEICPKWGNLSDKATLDSCVRPCFIHCIQSLQTLI